MNKAVNTSNFEKYGTKNPVVRFLLMRFFKKIRTLIGVEDYSRALDAGCGEGVTIQNLDDVLPDDLVAFDLNPESIAYAEKHCSKGEFHIFDINKLSFDDKDFELTLCCEVLEHLDSPDKALMELIRITSKTLIISVPHEPWFFLGSFFRGKYLSRWGRHPEHIQVWSKKSFKKFLKKNTPCNFSLHYAFPWIIAKIECKNDAV